LPRIVACRSDASRYRVGRCQSIANTSDSRNPPPDGANFVPVRAASPPGPIQTTPCLCYPSSQLDDPSHRAQVFVGQWFQLEQLRFRQQRGDGDVHFVLRRAHRLRPRLIACP